MPTNDSKPGTSTVPSTCAPPIGFGRSQTMTFTPVPARRLQAVRHRVDVGVDADADVLEVDDQHVEVREHLGGRLAGLAVERIDRHAADLVVRVPRLDHVVLHVRSEAVLRAEDRGERGAVVRRQAIGDVPQAGGRPRPDCRRCRRGGRRADRGQQASDPRDTAHFTIIGGDRLASDRARVDRLRAFGGQPRLLRPRREPIEPQVRLAPSRDRCRQPTCRSHLVRGLASSAR